MSAIRPIQEIIKSYRQREGGGFIVRRPFPTQDLSYIDPFLLIDEMGPADYGPGEAIGAPDHPHRGFETVTYMLDGEFEHEDSAGHRGTLRPGDIQWMTAGAGIVHSEMPSEQIRKEGGRIHGFQIWINLPADQKMSTPRYQERSKAEIPHLETPDGLAEVHLIAGRALGEEAVISTNIPITYQDWTLRPGADLTLEIGEEEAAMIFVFQGALLTGDPLKPVEDGQLARLGPGSKVRLKHTGEGETRALLLAGRPIGEPVARYGPFVMNHPLELQKAVLDYQSGAMGEITRTAVNE